MCQQPSVLFEEVLTANGKVIAIATLANPKSLNALTLAMIEQLQGQLDRWREQASVACVFLQGSGDRAFCAGGDVVSLYPHVASYGEALTSDYGQRFFSAEYRLDYSIHSYPKPIVVWGNGVVMGGGVGLMVGASHRVATETTRMAMPECAIGLYPDVGASWFLNRMPGRCGRFMALTGAAVGAADSKYLGMADNVVDSGKKSAVLESLRALEWTGDNTINHSLIADLLSHCERNSAGLSSRVVEAIQPWIDRHLAGSLSQAVAAVAEYSGDNPLLAQAADAIAGSCPVSLCLADEQLRRSAGLSLPTVFQQELVVSTNCTGQGHFKEGVRALLVDKDRQPRWQPAALEGVSNHHIQPFFQPPWQGQNPLANLG